MVLFGWINIYSASYNETTGSIFDLSKNYGKQFLFICISGFIAIFWLFLDNKMFSLFSYLVYGVLILLVISVFVIGKEVAGNKNWISLGSFNLQPAEFAKYGVSLALAKFLGTPEARLKDRNTLFIALGIFLLPMFLILLQKDTGSALVFLSFTLVLYREGLSGIWFVIAICSIIIFILTLYFGALMVSSIFAGIVLLVYIFSSRRKYLTWIMVLITAGVVGFSSSINFLMENVLAEHQRNRILVTFGLLEDLKNQGYNVHQSKIAIGSGGLFGKGYLEGTQTKLRYVPEQHTDFIFCTIGEEWGWVGSALMMLLFVTLIGRVYYLAELQKNRYNRIYAYCVGSVLFFHFTINIGMTIGLVPVIGIPLPFFSYGGSSLIGFTILLFTMIRLDSTRTNEMSTLKDMY
ncbi:MAG: rod shape-determining protein RodA [Flavobacteriales bacterium]|nr:rod shape-determining protein RodA [Flavobacteriales bacterium]